MKKPVARGTNLLPCLIPMKATQSRAWSAIFTFRCPAPRDLRTKVNAVNSCGHEKITLVHQTFARMLLIITHGDSSFIILPRSVSEVRVFSLQPVSRRPRPTGRAEPRRQECLEPHAEERLPARDACGRGPPPLAGPGAGLGKARTRRARELAMMMTGGPILLEPSPETSITRRRPP
jgi:hypothetical protein